MTTFKTLSSASVDDHDSLCKRAVAELGARVPGFFSGAGALTPAGRMGLELPGGASPPVFGTNNAYAATGRATASSCAQLYHSYDPATGTFLSYDGRRHACK